MTENYRSCLTVACVTTLLVLLHLLIQHGSCRWRSFNAVTIPQAVDPAPSSTLPALTKPIPIGNVKVKKKSLKITKKHSAAAKYVPGHTNAHPELCPRLGAKVLVAVMVTSAPANFAYRQAIRITWGTLLDKLQFPLVFVLGQYEDEQDAISLEDEEHGDLVVGNFIDSYSNLTLKSLSILEWMSKYCPRAAFLLKIDDDVFLNPRLLQKFATARLNKTRSIWGYLFSRARPHRSKKDKYHVPVVEYPGRRFPAYVSGFGYLMSGDSIGPMLEAAGALRFVHIEDVFVTGVVAAHVGIARRHSARFKIGAHTLEPPCELRQLMVLHEMRPRDHLELWWRLYDPDVKCHSNQETNSINQ